MVENERVDGPSRATAINGKAIAKALRADLKVQVDGLRAEGITPGLAVLLVGEDPASAIYVRNKERACRRVGIRSLVERLSADTTQVELMARLDALNAERDVDGILVQLPVPPHLDADAITRRVGADKDVDGFGMANLGALVAGKPGLVACTPAGAMAMLRHYGQAHGWQLKGKNAVVIGRSLTVGKPMALLLLAAHCTVTICHSRTRDLASHLANADLVVAAAGVPELVRGEWLRPGAVVIDVGIHRREDGSLCGDVHFDSAQSVAGALSPVPGGVGPMTIAMLLANTVQACRSRRGNTPTLNATGAAK